jgi:hypothetical protein
VRKKGNACGSAVNFSAKGGAPDFWLRLACGNNGWQSGVVGQETQIPKFPIFFCESENSQISNGLADRRSRI